MFDHDRFYIESQNRLMRLLSIRIFDSSIVCWRNLLLTSECQTQCQISYDVFIFWAFDEHSEIT